MSVRNKKLPPFDKFIKRFSSQNLYIDYLYKWSDIGDVVVMDTDDGTYDTDKLYGSTFPATVVGTNTPVINVLEAEDTAVNIAHPYLRAQPFSSASFDKLGVKGWNLPSDILRFDGTTGWFVKSTSAEDGDWFKLRTPRTTGTFKNIPNDSLVKYTPSSPSEVFHSGTALNGDRWFRDVDYMVRVYSAAAANITDGAATIGTALSLTFDATTNIGTRVLVVSQTVNASTDRIYEWNGTAFVLVTAPMVGMRILALNTTASLNYRGTMAATVFTVNRLYTFGNPNQDLTHSAPSNYWKNEDDSITSAGVVKFWVRDVYGVTPTYTRDEAIMSGWSRPYNMIMSIMYGTLYQQTISAGPSYAAPTAVTQSITKADSQFRGHYSHWTFRTPEQDMVVSAEGGYEVYDPIGRLKNQTYPRLTVSAVPVTLTAVSGDVAMGVDGKRYAYTSSWAGSEAVDTYLFIPDNSITSKIAGATTVSSDGGSSTTILEDDPYTAAFTTLLQPGMIIVFEDGSRRTVVSVESDDEFTVDEAIDVTGSAYSYGYEFVEGTTYLYSNPSTGSFSDGGWTVLTTDWVRTSVWPTGNKQFFNISSPNYTYPSEFSFQSFNLFEGSSYDIRHPSFEPDVVVTSDIIRTGLTSAIDLQRNDALAEQYASFKLGENALNKFRFVLLTPPQGMGMQHEILSLAYSQGGFSLTPTTTEYSNTIKEMLIYFFGGIDLDSKELVTGVYDNSWPLPKDIEIVKRSRYEIEFIEELVMLVFISSGCIEIVKGTKFDEPTANNSPTIYHRYLSEGWDTKYGKDIIKKYYTDVVIGNEGDFIQGDEHRNAVYAALAPVVLENGGVDSGNVANEILGKLQFAYYTKPTKSTNKLSFHEVYSFDDVSGSRYKQGDKRDIVLLNVASLTNDRENPKPLLYNAFFEFPEVEDFNNIYFKFDFTNLLNLKDENKSIASYINNKFTGASYTNLSSASIQRLFLGNNVVKLFDSIGLFDLRYFDIKLKKWMPTNIVQESSASNTEGVVAGYYDNIWKNATSLGISSLDPLGIVRAAMEADGIEEAEDITFNYNPFYDYSQCELIIPTGALGQLDYSNVTLKMAIKPGFKALLENTYIQGNENTYLNYVLSLPDNIFELEDKGFFSDVVFGKKMFWLASPPIVQHIGSDEDVISISQFKIDDPIFGPSELSLAYGAPLHGRYPVDVFRCLKSMWIE